MIMKWLVAVVVLNGALFVLPLGRHCYAADAGAILEADANRIDADITQLQADQQKVRALVLPDRKAVAAAQAKYDQDAAPLLAQLKADEALWKTAHEASRKSIEAQRTSGEASIRAMEQKLEQDRQLASRDKAAAARIPQEEQQVKEAREKLKADLKALEDKDKADEDTAKQKLAAERDAMKPPLQPDSDALKQAKQQLQQDSLWESKVDADRAALAADLQKLQADKAAAAQ